MPDVVAKRKEHVLNAFQDFFYATKSAGICLINSQNHDLVFSFGLNHQTKRLIRASVKRDCFVSLQQNIGALFNTQRELDFIRVKEDSYNRFIKVIDEDYFVYAYFDQNGNQDHGKIKFHLNAVKSKLNRIHEG